LFTGKDETLLIWGNTFFVLNFGLHIFDRIRCLNLERDGFSRQRLDEDLHTTAETEYEMKGRFLLDIVVRQCTPVFELLAREDETLLVWGNALFVLDFGLDVFNGVRCLDLERDRFAREGFHKDLHATT